MRTQKTRQTLDLPGKLGAGLGLSDARSARSAPRIPPRGIMSLTSYQTVSSTKKPFTLEGLNWVQGSDLNRGPSGYEPDELPDCSTLQ